MNSVLRLNFHATLSGGRFSTETNMKDERQELHELLSHLSDAPVASNFTARVMRAVELEDSPAARTRGWHWNWHSLLPRAAATAAVVIVAGFAFHQYDAASRRAEIIKSVMIVARAQKLPSVEALQNFDAIQRMSQPVHADEGLLALAPDLK